jgi:hypothetical protein
MEVIHLRSGGIIEMNLEFDPFRLDKSDREFIFELIDRVREYKAGLERSEHSEEPPF